jgi:hypothetical protein
MRLISRLLDQGGWLWSQAPGQLIEIPRSLQTVERGTTASLLWRMRRAKRDLMRSGHHLLAKPVTKHNGSNGSEHKVTVGAATRD